MSVYPYVDRLNVILMLILIASLIIDTIISDIYDLISNEVSSSLGVTSFIFITCVALGTGLVFLFRFLKHKNENHKKSNLRSDKLYNLTKISQLLITAIIVSIIAQIVWTSQYFATWIIIILVIGDLPFYATLCILTKKLFSWYGSNKRNMIVLLFGLVTVSTILTSILFDAGTFSILSAAPMVVQSSTFKTWQQSIYHFSSVAANSELYLDLGFAFLIGDFISLWIISAILLYDYSHRIGRSTTYWMVIFLPIALFLIGLYPTLLGFSNANFVVFEKQLISYRILAILAGVASVILFCISFLILARGARQIKEKTVADYLKIAGYGIALIMLTLISEIVLIPYPPFGIAACASLSLGTYLFYVGMYSSVISISGNMAVRKSIKKAAINELKPFDRIGTAQTTVRLQEEVRKIVKDHSNKMIQEADVMPYFSEEDAKKYLQEVLNELDKRRTSNK